jgi:hypothetical protein
MMPSTRWYSGGGLYRDVFLWTGGSVRVEPWDTFITTPVASEAAATVKVSYDIAADLDTQATIKATVLDASGNAVATASCTSDVCAAGKTRCELTLTVEHPALWSLETPTLYTLQTEITVDGKVTDTAESTFGIRTFTMDAKNGFLLNGKPQNTTNIVKKSFSADNTNSTAAEIRRFNSAGRLKDAAVALVTCNDHGQSARHSLKRGTGYANKDVGLPE